jgi:hypothetical protein
MTQHLNSKSTLCVFQPAACVLVEVAVDEDLGRITRCASHITNHKFTFSYTGIPKFQNIVIEIVEKAIEKSRDEFEADIFQNELELLENIVVNIKSKK